MRALSVRWTWRPCSICRPLRSKKEDRADEDFASIDDVSCHFDDLTPLQTHEASVSRKVRELRCEVTMDEHAVNTSRILDVEDFEGATMTHIPCLQSADIPNPFRIGVIVGPSGCGKTSSGERLFGRAKKVAWDSSRRIAGHFSSMNALSLLFGAVQLTLDLALSYFDELSLGEQHRVDIARQLDAYEPDSNATIIIDEFTSYIDRVTAMKLSKGVSDYIHSHDLCRVVILSCKWDVISSERGLSPTWLFDVENKKVMHFEHVRPLSREPSMARRSREPTALMAVSALWHRPKIRLVLRGCLQTDFTPRFAKFHYMDASIQPSAKCFSVWAWFGHCGDGHDDERAYYDDDELELVGFTSFLNHYGQCHLFTFREHRTVVLPSFQGLGFGSRIADCLGEYLSRHGQRLYSKTAHPRYGGYRDRLPSVWMAHSLNHTVSKRETWSTPLQRCLFGNPVDNGHAKRFFVHIYTLQSDEERTEEAERMLRERVVVSREYEIIGRS